MKHAFKIFIAIFAFATLLLVGLFYFRPEFFESGAGGPTVEINSHKFSVEIADEPGERSRGLGGRESLCDEKEKGGRGIKEMGIKGIKGGKGESCGMLFLFDRPGRYGFWMKDMKFPLDFVWIAGDKIVDIDKNIPPDYSGTLKPKAPADKVLEIDAGVCEKYEIETGDEIKIDLGLRRGGIKGIKGFR